MSGRHLQKINENLELVWVRTIVSVSERREMNKLKLMAFQSRTEYIRQSSRTEKSSRGESYYYLTAQIILNKRN